MSWTETELAELRARLRQRHAAGELRRQERRVRLGRRPPRPHPHHRGRDRHRRRPPEAAPQLRRLQQGVNPMNWLDRAIGAVAPGAGLRRARQRQS